MLKMLQRMTLVKILPRMKISKIMQRMTIVKILPRTKWSSYC